MNLSIPVPMATIGLLIMSSIFQIFAWYGHLKFPQASLWKVILISWLIAFFEYCLQVPANRLGYGYFNVAELKTIQEILSLSIFIFFTIFYIGEPLKWNYVVGLVMIVGAAFVIFHKW